MIHKKLILRGYIRLSLNQIDYFEYTPEKRTQTILGSNGSGKSSVLKELSPLPGDKDDFRLGGSKHIEIQHKGKHYTLISSFLPTGNTYEIFLNGENLNPGKTLTVYKELVKRIFNYTAEIHALLTGEVTFHSLSVSARRQWFMMMSDVDYSYAFAYYKRQGDKLRDVQGTLRSLQERLVKEQLDFVSATEEALIRDTVQQLKQEYQRLMSQRFTISQTASELTRTRQYHESQLNQQSGLLSSLLKQATAFEPRSKAVVSEAIQTTLAQVAVLKKEIEMRLEEGESLQKVLASSNAQLAAELEKEVKGYEADIDRIRQLLHFNFWTEDDDAERMASDFSYVRDAILSIFERINALPSYQYSRDAYESTQRLLNEVKAQRNHLAEQREKRLPEKHRLTELGESQPVDCPKCQHRWIPDYDALRLKQISEEILRLEDQIRLVDLQIEQRSLELSHREQYSALLNELKQNTNMASSLKAFWGEMIRVWDQGKGYSQIPGLFERAWVDLTLKQDKRRKEVALEKAKTAWLATQATQAQDVEKIKVFLERTEAKVAESQVKLRLAETELDRLQEYYEILEGILEIEQTVRDHYHQHRDAVKQLTLLQFGQMYDEMLHAMNEHILQEERKLSQIDLKKAVLVDLQQNIEQLKEDEMLLEASQKALSPKQGLIAKGLMRFIDGFATRLNLFVEKVWCFPLALEPIVPDEDNTDLDYRFRVKTSETGSSPDVLKTSKGQQEILNLAFVLVSMQYLGMENYPIFLDEFAAKMDQKHRQAAYDLIEYLIDHTEYSQIFIVSHYVEGYRNLSNNEVLVMCDANIVLPKQMSYNKHAIMR